MGWVWVHADCGAISCDYVAIPGESTIPALKDGRWALWAHERAWVCCPMACALAGSNGSSTTIAASALPAVVCPGRPACVTRRKTG